MLRMFVHRVAMLGVVGSNLNMVQFFMQPLWMLYDVVVVWPSSFVQQCCTLRSSSISIPHRVAERAQHVAPNNVAFKCCDRSVGACKCWAKNVAISRLC